MKDILITQHNRASFKSWASMYSKKAKEDEENAEEWKRRAAIYRFLATCEDQDAFALFDTGVFNEIVQGFVFLACDSLADEADNETLTKLSGAIGRTVRETRAEDALARVLRHIGLK